MNELLLLLSVVFIFGATLLAYALFGKTGLYCMTALASVLANIEVLILVKAFGIEQTLGNVLFAATFLITDILSECESKKAAEKAVWIGVFSSLFFLGISQSWLLYSQSGGTSTDAFSAIFSNTPRMIAASLAVYIVSQTFDVWLYHKWWAFTERKFGNKRRFLWLRNNGSTLVSQLLNSFLFTFAAFYGTYDMPTLMSIFGFGYLIFVVTSLIDTPIVYLARRINDGKKSALPLDRSNSFRAY